MTVEEIKNLETAALREIRGACNPEDLERLRVYYLGRKGALTGILRGLGKLAPEIRRGAGQEANRAKEALEAALDQALSALKTAARLAGTPAADVTLPGRRLPRGRLHPLNRIMAEVCDIFLHLGFEAVEGPEVELDWYNFEALNLPPDHPARDMQDTFYFSDKVLLRTHTSPMQIRTMEVRQPPVRIIAPGKVYRRDSDITHSPMFHQVEGLLVDTGVTFADLKGVLTAFVHQMFGPEVGSASGPATFPSPNHPLKSISNASCAAATAAGSARPPAGWRSWAPAWSTPRSSRPWATTRKPTPASPSAWASNASPCSSTGSTTSASSSTTT